MSLLSEVKNPSKWKVVGLSEAPIKVKLMEMGLLEGQEIAFLFKAPFGDPIAIEVNDYVLSLRLDEAQYIQVESIDKA